MLLWHLGGTIAIVRYAFRDDRMDLRFLMLGAVLPDLLDTPFGLALYDYTRTVRLATHSLTVAALVMAVVVGRTRRGRPRKRWMPLAIGMLVHLVLDAMWAAPETLWWPFLGLGFTENASGDVVEYVTSLLTDPTMWALEALGAAYLIVIARRAALSDPERRHDFLSTGRIDVPIDG